MTITSSGSSWSLLSWSTPLLKRRRKGTESQKTSRVSKCSCEEVNKLDTYGRSLLFYAARYDQPEVAIQLLEAGCDPNVGDDDGITPLHEAVDAGSYDVLKLLIKQGCCDVNRVDNAGESPLMYATMKDDIEMTKLLIKSGARINDVDNMGRSAFLIGLHLGSERACLHLLKCGCDVNQTDLEGHSALHFATYATDLQTLDIARKLLKSGYTARKDSEWLKKAGECSSCLFQKDEKFYKHVLSKAGIKSKKSEKPELIKTVRLTYIHKVFHTRAS
ncbi:poly [ADP-ribose] polymerase tankyrase-2-like [Ylistrum balloti]|uniref:poly [ADP-ribose] polymerase tankyrase-2-like n=1 Tax=Ylistrum balloti TaxID=509963 RepID=UPI002905DBD7|nr:poly [ADP-ribose] polymerase tankyrase-2-like [Ylistrum balloti]